MERAETALESARVRLAQAQGNYGNVKGMKKPAEPQDVPLKEEA